MVVVQRCSVREVFLEISQNSQENTCARVSFLINLQVSAGNFIENEILTQVYSYGFCEISKNTEYLQATASVFIHSQEDILETHHF